MIMSAGAFFFCSIWVIVDFAQICKWRNLQDACSAYFDWLMWNRRNSIAYVSIMLRGTLEVHWMSAWWLQMAWHHIGARSSATTMLILLWGQHHINHITHHIVLQLSDKLCWIKLQRSAQCYCWIRLLAAMELRLFCVNQSILSLFVLHLLAVFFLYPEGCYNQICIIPFVQLRNKSLCIYEIWFVVFTWFWCLHHSPGCYTPKTKFEWMLNTKST